MCQAHLPTPGEGRGRGPAEGRGEGRGSGAGENLFVLLRAESSPLLLAALRAPRRASHPASAARPGRRCSPEGARAPRPPDPPPAPRAGHLCQVGLSSRRWRGRRSQRGEPGQC